MKQLLRSIVFVAVALSMAITAFAQDKSRGSLECRDNWYSDRLLGHCEIREQTLPAGGTLSVDARKNGGISIKGWDRAEVLVRARVQAAATTENEAVDLAKQVKIETAGGKIYATGPSNRENYHWNVSYEIFTPRRSDLSLETYNGGISISDVSGKIDFTALNGGVVLRRVGGNVHGGTTNGGIVVELEGSNWDGETLDVKTTNGGIVMSVPENYSAHLQTGTVNGHLSVDFPVTVQGKISKELAVNLGSGGATVRAMTTNGGVKIKRLGSSN